MSDMVATLGLDDAEYRRGLDRADEKARGFSRSTDAALKGVRLGLLGAAGAAWTLADTFARVNPEMSRPFLETQRALRDIRTGIGRDLVNTLDFSAQIDGINKLRQVYVDFYTDVFGGEARAVNAARVLEDEMIRLAKAVRAMAPRELELREQMLRSSGRDEDADLVAERLKHRQNLEANARVGNENRLSNTDISVLNEAEERRHAAAIANIRKEHQERRDKQASEMAAKAATAAREHEDAVRGIGIVYERDRVDRLRLAGHDREAELLAVELDYRERMLTISREESLTANERLTAEGYAQLTRAKTIELINRQHDADRDLEAARASARRQDFEDAVRAMEIDNIRAAGRDREADTAALRLRAEEKIRSIRGSEDISDGDKQRLIDRVTALTDERIALLGVGSRRGPSNLSLPTGLLGGVTVRQQALAIPVHGQHGPLKQVAVAEAALVEQRKTNEKLDIVARKIENQRGAAYQ